MTVLLVERLSGLKVIAVSEGLNFKSRDSLSALTSENFESCPFCPRFCVEQVQYCRSERRHFEIVFPLSRFVPGYRQLELPARIIFVKIAAPVYLLTFAIQISRWASRSENEAS